MAELDEVRDGEESEDREEVTAETQTEAEVTRVLGTWLCGTVPGAGKDPDSHVHSSLLSTSTSASESLSSSGAATATGAGVSGAPGGSTVSFRFRGWRQVARGSGARETTAVHGGLLTTFC